MEIRIHFVSGQAVDVTGIDLRSYDTAAKDPQIHVLWAVNRVGKPMSIRVDATTHAEELAD